MWAEELELARRGRQNIEQGAVERTSELGKI